MIIQIKKRLGGIEESAELIRPVGGAQNNYNYIVIQSRADCQGEIAAKTVNIKESGETTPQSAALTAPLTQGSRAQMRLTEVIGALFEAASEADRAYLDAIIGGDAREARAAKRAIERVIANAGLKEAHRRWEAEA